VAKRPRASRASHRPGGQGPTRSRKSGDTSMSDAAYGPETSSGADIDAAVETVESGYSELMVDETTPATTRTRRVRRSIKARADSLPVRAAAEDAFVREDLRRIGIVTVVLVIGLAVAWVLFFAMDVLGLY
jgi:hypothetical protein